MLLRRLILLALLIGFPVKPMTCITSSLIQCLLLLNALPLGGLNTVFTLNCTFFTSLLFLLLVSHSSLPMTFICLLFWLLRYRGFQITLKPLPICGDCLIALISLSIAG